MRMTEAEYTALIHANPDIGAPPRSMGVTRRLAGETPTEQAEHEAVIQWRDMTRAQWPALEWLHHIPNGGARDKVTAALMKRAGVVAGVPDLFLPVPMPRHDGGDWHGLYVELKRADHSNGPTAEQKRWLDHLRSAGYLVAVCYGATQAIKVITTYLGGDDS